MQRDGLMVVNGNQGSTPNYEPNSVEGSAVEDPTYAEKPFAVSGLAQRNKFNHDDIDFEQPRAFWTKVMKEENKVYLTNAMAGDMKTCRQDIKDRMIKVCTKIDSEFGERLTKDIERYSQRPKL